MDTRHVEPLDAVRHCGSVWTLASSPPSGRHRHGGSTNLLVVDGDTGARMATAAVLRGLGHRVVEVGSCHDAVDTVRHRPIDLALLEVDLPDGDGYRLARQLREADDPAIVFVTAADRLQDELAAFDAGADDYVLKTDPVAKLVVHVEAVLRRVHTAGAVWRVADLVVDESSGAVTRAGAKIDLTRTELRLLTILVRHRDTTVTKAQLLSTVWGDEQYGHNIVEQHISRLRRKLEVHGPRMIHTVHQFGYILRTRGNAS